MGILKKENRQKLSMKQTFQIWLLVFVVCAFTMTLAISFYIQTRQARSNAVDLIRLKVEDAKRQIKTNSENLERVTEMNNNGVLAKTRALARIIAGNPEYEPDTESLTQLLAVLDVDEINLVDGNGIITATTNPLFLGYDMASASQSREFMPILVNPSLEVVQMPRSIGYDANIVMQYAGVGRSDAPGLVQIGYMPGRLNEAMELANIRNLALGFRIGTGGGILVCQSGVIVSAADDSLVGKSLDRTGISLSRLKEEPAAVFTVQGKEQLCYFDKQGSYTIIGMMPTDEMYINRDAMVVFLIICNFVLFALVFALVSLLVSRVVISGIYSVNRSLNRITQGNLEETVEVNTNNEFSMLSEGINSTVAALKNAIGEAAARIDKELEFAKAIQSSALPTVMPDRYEFDLYASMRTAKEVGGDFYDFFQVDDDHLALVIADVSGKGIPAALFMMTGKTMIKNLAESGLPPEQVLTQANAELCEGNDAGMFITVWMGILTVSTGVLNYANAGHNPPLLRRADGGFEYLRSRAGFVLAGMEGVRYRPQRLEMKPGDALYLYTDGVTEATSEAKELYGEERLKMALDQNDSMGMKNMLEAVLADVDRFVEETPQFDDITMLGLHYLGDGMEHLEVAASLDEMERVTRFAEAILEKNGCPMKIETQVNIAVDELFSNICRYSGSKRAWISCGVPKRTVRLIFVDEGRPYNPLEQEEPDVTESADERAVGGLGILIVKKSMDHMEYEYRDGRNILTLEKRLGDKSPE